MSERPTVSDQASRRYGLFGHEIVLLFLGTASSIALVARAGLGNPVFWEVASVSIVCGILFKHLGQTTSKLLKFRLILASLYIVWFYSAIARITPALGLPRCDLALYQMDIELFGVTLAVRCEEIISPRMTDVMSLSYLSYHAYLITACLHALSQPSWYTFRCFGPIMTAFAVGMIGYLLVPAVGPAVAYTDLFSVPLTGDWPTQLNVAIVGWGCSIYDVFPSLHILITACLLEHDWRYCRRRFYLMAPVSILLVVSTIYLRYHYAVDLLAGFAIYVMLSCGFKSRIARRWFVSSGIET